jgi:hypothetical protein
MVRIPLAWAALSLAHRVRDPYVLVPPVAVAVVLRVLGGQHEDVLVHEGWTEGVHLNRSFECFDGWHRTSSSGGLVEMFRARSAPWYKGSSVVGRPFRGAGLSTPAARDDSGTAHPVASVAEAAWCRRDAISR